MSYKNNITPDNLMKFCMSRIIGLLILVVLLDNYYIVNAQMIRRLTHSDGLPSSSVMASHSADNGFLWLGTVDGLCIYDGNTIHPFNTHYSHNTLSGNLIHSINETPFAMWIQTNYGLDRLSKSSNNIEEFSDFREDRTFVSDNGEIIFSLGPSNKLFYYLDGVSQTFLPIEEISISRPKFRYVTWMDNTLRIFEEEGVKSFLITKKDNGTLSISKQLPYQKIDIEKCFHDSNGMMWIVDSQKVIWHYDQTTGNLREIADMSRECKSRGSILSIARLKDSNELFIGFQWNDVIKLQLDNSGQMLTMTALGINSGISRIEPDKNQEVIWILTDGNGVYKYIDAEVSIRSVTYNELSHIITRPVRALWADEEGTLWVGTKGDGIMRLMNFKSTTLFNPLGPKLLETANSSLLHKEIYAFSPSCRPILWIGTEGGLNYYSYVDRKIKVLPFPVDALFPQCVHSIYEESENVLWVASSGQGIYRLSLSGLSDNPVVTSVKDFSNDNGAWSLNFFFAIHPGKGGAVYGVNRGYGAIEIRNNEMSMLPLLKDYPTRMVNDMFAIETQGDTLWFGTGAGVIRKIGNEETLYDRSAGLSNATIHALVMAANKDLWISTNDGLACLNTETGNIRLYNHTTGVEVNEFSDGAFCRNGNDIYFGGVDGIVAVSLASKSSPMTVDYSPIMFTGISIGGINHPLNIYDNGNKVKIGSNENSFAIEMVAPDHINGAHYNYYYKLSKDKDWSPVENNKITFSHLPSGSYHLMARYVDAVTGYESPVETLDFEVLAPWYLTWWAKLIYILLVLSALAGGIYYALLRQRKQQKLKIKELKQQQKEKLYEDKLRFFTGITHEFNAPLTLIYGPCERILNHRGIDGYTQRYVNLIRHNAERLNSLIQEIIDFGRIESGAMPRVINEVNVSRLCEDILQLFTSLEEQNSVKLERDIETDVVWNTDLRSINKILYNLLSNAFKYTPSYGTIRLSLHKTGDFLELKVYNTGKGIEDKDKKRIFDRYILFGNMEENATKGLSSRNGLGMATCKAMIELLEGEIKIESEIGKYAEFIVRLPNLPLSSSISKEVLSDSLPILHSKTVEMPEIAFPLNTDKTNPKNNRKISMLIIDDDAEILHLLTDSMAQEYEVYTANNAEAGLKIVIEKSPDIIITDVMMAGEGGLWFTRKVKEDRHTAHIPIVMLSAKSTSMDKIAGLKSGADAYVAKPFSTDYLREVVKRLLSSRGELKDYYNSSASAFEYVDGKVLTQTDKDFIKKLKEVVEESIGDLELTADALAEKMNMSTRNFYRKMKTLELPPPIDFIRQHRIKHAAHLLATTSMPIQEVVTSCGFNNRSYFYKEFDKVYGMTPKSYRVQQQNNIKGMKK